MTPLDFDFIASHQPVPHESLNNTRLRDAVWL